MSSGTRANETAGYGGPLRDEPISDSPLIENLEGPRVQTAGTRPDKRLARPQFDDDDVDPRQRELARQHQTGRASADDHNLVLGHAHTPAARVRLIVEETNTRRSESTGM